MKLHGEGGVDEKIFAFTDALSVGDRREAFRLYDFMRNSGFSELYLLGALGNTLRTMIKIKSILPTNPDYRAYEAFGLHPFVLKKTLSQVRRFRMEDLKRLYRALLQCDVRLKSTALDPETVVVSLISQF